VFVVANDFHEQTNLIPFMTRDESLRIKLTFLGATIHKTRVLDNTPQ